MSRRSKIFILIVVCLALIIALIWFIMRPQLPVIRQTISTSLVNLPQATNVNVTLVNNSLSVKSLPVKPDLSVTLKAIALMFAERYGSFSNQSNFQNLKDLESMMTAEFFDQNEIYLKEQAAKAVDNSVYYGITSKVVKNELTNLDEAAGLAILKLTLQRREAKVSMSNETRVFYQDLIIKLKKEGKDWEIASALWQ